MKTRFLPSAVALTFSAAVAYCSTVTIMVQETALRKRAQSYAPSVGTARLGQTFESEGLESGFYKTRSGYIHSSAVTTKKIHIGSADSVGGAASADEIGLAGKGFNAQVEKSYGAQNGSADFAAVNAMERRIISEASLFEFLQAGSLIPQGGSK